MIVLQTHFNIGSRYGFLFLINCSTSFYNEPLSSVSAGSNITVSSTPSADGKKTEYQVGLAKDLSGLTSASFTNGKTGGEEQTALVSAGGLSLGEGDAAARFTRSGISAGGQQVTKVGSGLQKVTDTSYLSLR